MRSKSKFINILEKTNTWDVIEWYRYLEFNKTLTYKEQRDNNDSILEKLLQHFDREDYYRIKNSDLLFKQLSLRNILDSL